MISELERETLMESQAGNSLNAKGKQERLTEAVIAISKYGKIHYLFF